MIDDKIIAEELIRDFTENYMGKVFYFCLRKTNDSYEAEDLASDITLSVISALSKNLVPRNFSAWVWQIARNQYSKWAAGKSKKLKRTESTDVDGFDVEDDYRFEETLVTEELLLLVKRELAFISSDYRDILVAFYIDDRKIRDIAASLKLPEGTVKTKLFRARNILKEGIDMAREFGRRSYKPEEISFSNSCSSFGEFGQPWTILNHSMYKNIFLEVYNNPETSEQLALELGIALPYMEDELEFLVRETFLTKNRDKYETSFPIISKEAQIKLQEEIDKWTPQATEMLEKFVETVCSVFEKNGESFYGNYQTYEDAKWTLLMSAYDHFGYRAKGYGFEYTKRPNNGAWDITGYENVDLKNPPHVGLHGSYSDTRFSQYKFGYHDIHRKTPEYLSKEEGDALKSVIDGKIDDVKHGIIENLIKYGYIKVEDGKYIPQVLVIKDFNEAIESMNDEDKATVNSLRDSIKEYFKGFYSSASEIIIKDLPKSMRENERIVHYVIDDTLFDRRFVFMHALNTGWIKYDENTSKTVGAHFMV